MEPVRVLVPQNASCGSTGLQLHYSLGLQAVLAKPRASAMHKAWLTMLPTWQGACRLWTPPGCGAEALAFLACLCCMRLPQTLP